MLFLSRREKKLVTNEYILNSASPEVHAEVGLTWFRISKILPNIASASAFYTFENPQVRRSAFYRRPRTFRLTL